jgi:hypothetical protein
MADKLYSSIQTNAKTNIEGGTIENAIYSLCKYAAMVEREQPDVNPSGANNITVTEDDNGNIRITCNLKYTSGINADGNIVIDPTPYLVEPV